MRSALQKWSAPLGFEDAALGMVMANSILYPLSFSPIFRYRLWDGRGLARWFDTPLPGEDRIGEAWVLSDRDDYPSRVLQIEQAPACIDFKQGAINPLASVVEEAQTSLSERLLQCSHFQVWRIQSSAPLMVGEAAAPRILVCLSGAGNVAYGSRRYSMRKGGVVLLPACLGQCRFHRERPVTLLEIGVPAS